MFGVQRPLKGTIRENWPPVEFILERHIGAVYHQNNCKLVSLVSCACSGLDQGSVGVYMASIKAMEADRTGLAR